jgi:hypothetical protein
MAERYFRGRSAIGGKITFGRGPATVVGVARRGKYSALNEAPRNYMYLSVLQLYRPDWCFMFAPSRIHSDSCPPCSARFARSITALPLFDGANDSKSIGA